MRHAEIYFEREQWKRPLAWSAALHATLFGSMLLYAALVGVRGGTWGGSGGGGGALSVNLVSTIPLPASPEGTNVLATESKGLSETQPQQKVEQPEAIAIPERESKPKGREQRTTRVREVKPPESNVVPFGQGGPVSGPYGVFSAPNAKGGFGFSGGGGDFGSRYAWYVDIVRRKVSENWLKYEVDPGISSARRVYITFDILRSGEPANIQLSQSSGVPSLDQSAMRALQRIDTFGPLPGDYPGRQVSVEFWFDYRR